jgi:hypothetical protein
MWDPQVDQYRRRGARDQLPWHRPGVAEHKSRRHRHGPGHDQAGHAGRRVRPPTQHACRRSDPNASVPRSPGAGNRSKRRGFTGKHRQTQYDR